MSKQVMLNQWPESQVCICCKHSCFVNEEKVGSSAYICMKNIDAEECPMTKVYSEGLKIEDALKEIEHILDDQR